VAELMSQLREEKARAYHGDEAWAAADDRAKVVRTGLPSAEPYPSPYSIYYPNP
jgi:hypothetical protein